MCHIQSEHTLYIHLHAIAAYILPTLFTISALLEYK